MKQELVQKMRVVLGSAFTLYLNSQAAHWNVEGMFFKPLHDLFGEQYNEIWASIDETAEHIRALDAYAPSSMERFIALSAIKSAPAAPCSAREMIEGLLADHETMIAVLKDALHCAEECDEQGLVDFLGGRCDAHAKHRWMLRASAKSLAA